MDNDLDRSAERLARSEETRARLTGFGTGKQGQAIERQYHDQLADFIAANRGVHRRERVVWAALRGIDIDDLVLRLLTAGITVCFDDGLGVDDDGEKNFRDITLWIARNLVAVRDRELAFKVGVWGINRLLSLPIFELRDDGILELVLTDQLDTVLTDVLVRAVIANPLLTPSAAPPQPWTGVRKGGLPSGHWAQPPLIRDHHPSIENAARKAIGTGRMKPLLDAIHALQTVPFTINLPVLHFLRRWNPPPMPVAPDKSKLTPGQYWHAKKKHSEVLGERTAWDLIVTTAEAMPERFYGPLNIDFRGRIYPIPHFNFTRDDRVRGLFLFADGKPIGEEGLLWLKAHVAARADGVAWSSHGGPRLSELDFKKRIAWTDANSELLLKIGKAVLDCDDPAKLDWALQGNDEPIQFIAASVELVQAWDNPEFVTRLPLTFDASCSGLQHLCAMTRDEEGARYVNLIPSLYRPATAAEADAIRDMIDTPTEETDDAHQVADDFYRRVAYGVWQRDPELLETPFDRKLVKRPAMSYFYGARAGGFQKDKRGNWKPYGMTKQVIDAGAPTKHAKELAHAIYDCIEDMLRRPKAVRDWLEQLAGEAAKKCKPLRWVTPVGLEVINIYQPAKVKNLSVVVNGPKRSVKLTVGDKNGIDKKKAANAITANFVHSADAAHLQLVAVAAAKEGIEMVSVHDCFGTIASHAGRLNEIIRDQFIELHKRHNWLSNIWVLAKRDGIKLPPFSNIGTLDLEQVRQSFSAYR
jgi:DNA-directed RNA polymerase